MSFFSRKNLNQYFQTFLSCKKLNTSYLNLSSLQKQKKVKSCSFFHFWRFQKVKFVVFDLFCVLKIKSMFYEVLQAYEKMNPCFLNFFQVGKRWNTCFLILQSLKKKKQTIHSFFFEIFLRSLRKPNIVLKWQIIKLSIFVTG